MINHENTKFLKHEIFFFFVFSFFRVFVINKFFIKFKEIATKIHYLGKHHEA
jgi:hypothetical protein